jgi:hypothetical protein
MASFFSVEDEVKQEMNMKQAANRADRVWKGRNPYRVVKMKHIMIGSSLVYLGVKPHLGFMTRF